MSRSGLESVSNADRAFSKRRKEPWRHLSGLPAVLDMWAARGVNHQLVLKERLPPEPARMAPVPAALHAGLRQALALRGITELYGHQAQAFELLSARKDVVVATPTASGKSLCYNLPLLDTLARDSSARALYLFPTKALCRDQEEAVRAFMRDAGMAPGTITYDGDTPADARRVARERGRLILSNPDMLHTAILPHHANWSRLFSNLRFVVVDELHSYRGVFGSHLANVLRRLMRVARFHGAEPTFVFTSATIGNPREHAERMLGRPVELIDDSGAPRGPRQLLVYNPPIVNAELGIRGSVIKTSVRLAADLILADVPTLVFGQSRRGVEMMLKYLRDRLAREKVDPESVQAYRGGYLPETRRRIEASLRDGSLRGVVATNALELGIDIGSLDAVICAGYPGSVAGLFQRFGRAGRRGNLSLAMLVTSSLPTDQYIARHADWLLGAPIEEARIDPDNVEILVQHLKCAAFELPFEQGEGFGDVPVASTTEALDFLSDHGLLHPALAANGKTTYHWSSEAYPASHVSLRSASWDNFVIIDLDGDRTIAEMDFRSTHTMLHEQAIYQHHGEQYQVERLDFENHKGYVRKVKPDYYTTALTHTKVAVLVEEQVAALKQGSVASVGLGEVSVVEKVVGYKKVKFHSHENVGYGEVHLPQLQKHTTSFWLTVPEALVAAQAVERPVVIDALRGLVRAMHTVAAVGLMTDPRDLGHTLVDHKDPAVAGQREGQPLFDPTLFIYDQVAGGIGLAPRLFEEREALLTRTRELIKDCGCDDGCPSCIGPEAGLPEVLQAPEVSQPPDQFKDQCRSDEPIGERPRRDFLRNTPRISQENPEEACISEEETRRRGAYLSGIGASRRSIVLSMLNAIGVLGAAIRKA